MPVGGGRLTPLEGGGGRRPPVRKEEVKRTPGSTMKSGGDWEEQGNKGGTGG